jgi:aminoglycoside phosphotransferase (APT) family kinase protein
VHVASSSLDQLASFLRVRGWIPPQAALTTRTTLSNGSSVLTLRVTTDAGMTRVLRQPSPAAQPVERLAPSATERLSVEGAFYRLVQSWPAVADRMPTCLGADRSEHVIALEDLGTAATLADLYRGRVLSPDDVDDLTAYLVALHTIPLTPSDAHSLRADGLRLARHAERFEQVIAGARVEALASREPRIDRLVDAIRTDVHIRATTRDLGARFLEGKGVLLHGDFRPARWMPSPHGLRVLSPGCASTGPAALDLGYFLGHLLLAGQPYDAIAGALRRYRRAAPLDVAEVSACAGLELIRGRLGPTPVPVDPPPGRLVAELEYAVRLLRGGATVELPL